MPSKSIRDLGVMVDDDLTLTAHASHLSSSCFYQLRQLRAIRRSLSTDTAHALVRALVHSRLDYCNGVLAEIQHRSATICASIGCSSHIATAKLRQCDWSDATSTPLASNSGENILQTVHVGIQMPAQPCAVVSDWTVCSCGCCSWTYAATIGCQGRSCDSRYTNQNYWSTWFFICLSVGLKRFAYAFERPFHHFHNFQKTAENFFILEILITVWITARAFEAICLIGAPQISV